MDFFNLKFDNSTSSIKTDLDEFKVYAHENESLMDHINKTSLIFNSIIDEDVLFNFYNKFLENDLINLSFDMFKSIIVDSINYHDIGKISYNFQINRLNKDNPVILSEQNNFLKENNFDNFLNDLTPLHSFTSSIVFLLKYKEILEEMLLFLDRVDSEGTVFRSNHASNYLPLAGTLNADIPVMQSAIRRAMQSGYHRLFQEYGDL